MYRRTSALTRQNCGSGYVPQGVRSQGAKRGASGIRCSRKRPSTSCSTIRACLPRSGPRRRMRLPLASSCQPRCAPASSLRHLPGEVLLRLATARSAGAGQPTGSGALGGDAGAVLAQVHVPRPGKPQAPVRRAGSGGPAWRNRFSWSPSGAWEARREHLQQARPGSVGRRPPPGAGRFSATCSPDRRHRRYRSHSRCPLACARLRYYGGGLFAVAYLYRQLGDLRDLGYLERRSARDLGLGRSHILIAEVRE